MTEVNMDFYEKPVVQKVNHRHLLQNQTLVKNFEADEYWNLLKVTINGS